MRTRSFAVLTLLPALLSTAWAQPAFLVKDIGDAVPQFSSLLGVSAQADGVLYFPSDDGIHGTELWRSDGTAAGTRLVRDLCPGSCSSSFISLKTFQHRIYWGDGLLWVSDGTPQGTAPFPGPGSPAAGKDLIPLGEVRGRLLLSGSGSKGELWATDGTTAGTVHLRDFPSSPGRSFTQVFLIGQSDGVLFFGSGYSSTTLWATDGTATGTVPLLKGALSLGFGTVAGGRLFFEVLGPSTRVAWVSDGTPAGTQPLAGVSFDSGLAALGSQVLFFQGSFTIGWELWKSDGTLAGTSLVKALGRFLLEPMTVVGSRLFFSRDGNLWVSDGTADGTLPVRQLSAGISSGFVPLDGRLAFFADDGAHGVQPWTSDGTPAGTYPLAELPPGSTVGSGLGVLGDRWLFDVRDSRGWFLWASGSAPGSLSRVGRLNAQTSSFPLPMSDLGGTLLFSATDAASGQEIWRTDGSAAGTFRVKDIQPGSGSSSPYPLARIGNRFFFSANDTSPGLSPGSLWETDGTAAGTLRVPAAFSLNLEEREAARAGTSLYVVGSGPAQSGLFKTDGTDAGTVLLHHFDFRTERLQQLTVVGDRLFFVQSLTGPQLWTSDGTVSGTEPVVPLHRPAPWVALGSRLLFTAENAAGTERYLWASDGTAADTHRITRIARINPGVPRDAAPRGTPLPRFVAVAAGRVFFVGDDEAHGAELWSTDGTVAGTGMVADVVPGASGSAIESLTAVGRRIFFTADDGAHGRELWVSDGTVAGTHMVADIVRGAGSSRPDHLTAVDGLLLFSADDGAHGSEPWVSDGTRKGTRMLQDIAPGPLPSSPSGFRISGRNVYFSATDAVHGFELWAVPREALAAQP